MENEESCFGQEIIGWGECLNNSNEPQCRSLGKLSCDQCIGEVVEMAFTDELTSLPNRRGINLLFSRLIQAEKSFGALTTDLENFKYQNDAFSHYQGDLLLVHTADFLTGLLRPTDLAFRRGHVTQEEELVVGRRGGDEFVALIDLSVHRTESSCSPQDRMQAIADRIQIGFSEYLPIVEHNSPPDLPHNKKLGIKTGWAVWQPGEDLNSLIHRADT